MKSKFLILAAALAVPTPTLARNVEVYPTQSVKLIKSGFVGLSYGIETAAGVSARPGSAVTLTPAEERKGERVTLEIAVRNSAGAPVAFGPGNITATAEGIPIAQVDHAQLVREMKNRQFWADIGETFGEALNSSRATSTFTSTGTIGGQRYASTTTYVSPVMRAITDRENAAADIAHEDQQRAARTRLEGGKLPGTMLAPGTETRGYVTFVLPAQVAKMRGQFALTVAVDVGGEVHHFDLAAYRN